jgi:hypothetical protein
MRPDAPGDVRPLRAAQLAPGVPAPTYGSSLRLDDLQPAYVTQFRTLLLQRSPFESRPPADYRRVWQGGFYEVWQRGRGQVLAHHPAGGLWDATGVVSCGDLQALGRLAQRENATLAAAERAQPVIGPVDRSTVPRNWQPVPNDPQTIATVGPGRLDTAVRVPAGGSWTLWLAGSFPRKVTVRVDGRAIGALADDLSYSGLARRVGATTLAAGAHRIEIVRPGGSLKPGDGATGSIGPLALTPDGRRADGSVRFLDGADYRKLCGRQLDWVEVVRDVPRDGS